MSNELHDACQQGHLPLAKELVEEAGYDIDKPHSVYHAYPIYYAAQQGHLDIIEYLLSKNAKASDSHNTQGNLLAYICYCRSKKKQKQLWQLLPR